MKNLIRGIRNIRTEMNVAPSRKAQVYIVADDTKICDSLKELVGTYQHMISASEVFVQMDKTGIDENAVSVVIDKATVYMPLADLIDFEKELARIEKEKANCLKQIALFESKLSNEAFVSRAPEKVVNDQKEKLAKNQALLAQLIESEKRLKK